VTLPDGRIIVSYDDTVTGAKMNSLTGVTKQFGSRITLEKISGKLSKRIAGGDAIYGGQYRCSLGFNVRNSAGVYYFLTAGHCGNIASRWYSNSSHTTLLGNTAGSSFPGNDYAIVRYASSYTNHPGAVDLYNGSSQDITTAANAFVGESVKRSGSTTHVHSGSVTGTNATVNYAEGTVRGVWGRLRRRDVRRRVGPRPDLRRQRQLLLRRHHLLPARHRTPLRLRRQRLLIPADTRGTPCSGGGFLLAPQGVPPCSGGGSSLLR
jgi:hypothetical protein